ncbi:hypothetical protein V7S43_010342 [Phytophthora oleae]|uniref:Protein kinase domain-containing protein n=1 Tax=Phytophthora oleae TaxID=2107226 RepID=A0ABD3FCF7_9STRA
MMSRYISVLVVLLSFCRFIAAETTYWVYAHYNSSTSCDGTPYSIYAWEEAECTPGDTLDCSVGTRAHTIYSACMGDDYLSTMGSLFGSTPYLIREIYNDSSCSILYYAYGVPATGACEGTINVETNYPTVATLDVNGQSSIQYFNDAQCENLSTTEIVVASTLSSHSCDQNYRKWYSSADDLSEVPSASGSTSSDFDNGSDNTGSSTGAIVGIVCGGVVAVLVCVGFFTIYRRRSQGKQSNTLTTTAGDTMSLELAMRGQTELWNDFTDKRIPRDKVKVKDLLSSGAYGEVYKGVYNRQEVAVKMLLPSTRGNLQHVNDFLTEAKLIATMDHPHIITFVGIAWDSLSDMCVVLEFMDGGDLRTLLTSYEEAKHPVGFDKQKATIALHVCEALTYLHSLMPPVISRDLKSRNLLLNRNLEAKLTDFGISKERLDKKMTAGVGTSLWMAPEVMLGEKYDVKADIFSLGVVLSELDVHTLPYTQAKERSLASTERKMADATLLQKITSGEIRVEFSELNPQPLLELGLACVSVDPAERPTAAEAMYILQMAIRQELD